MLCTVRSLLPYFSASCLIDSSLLAILGMTSFTSTLKSLPFYFAITSTIATTSLFAIASTFLVLVFTVANAFTSTSILLLLLLVFASTSAFTFLGGFVRKMRIYNRKHFSLIQQTGRLVAAVEKGFQIEIFEGRRPNEQEMLEWGSPYSLGENGRRDINGYPLEFYITKLEEVRDRTLQKFATLTDDWLYENRLWDNYPSNNYFIWFHVFEDEINHRGQIRIIRKMLSSE